MRWGRAPKQMWGECPLDLNLDGWIDFVVGDSWYENTGHPKNEPFILHRKNLISCHDNIAVDVDQDGIQDIVSLSNDPDHPVLAWYKIPEDIGGNWDYTKIGSGIHGGIAPYGYGDLDGDGDPDIVRGDVWFENLDSKGGQWKKHAQLTPPGGSRIGKFGLAVKTWCFDMDLDNDLDIVQAEADTESGRVYWFENRDNAGNFVFHMISGDPTHQDFHSLALADFDGDGDQDVLSGGGPLSTDTHQLLIWENVSGKGQLWKEHIILTGKRVHEAVAADVDQDGDMDICSKPWGGGLHFYMENKLVD